MNQEVVTENAPSGAFLVHCANQLADVAHTDHSVVPLGLDDCEASDHWIAIDHDCIDTVISPCAQWSIPPILSPQIAAARSARTPWGLILV